MARGSQQGPPAGGKRPGAFLVGGLRRTGRRGVDSDGVSSQDTLRASGGSRSSGDSLARKLLAAARDKGFGAAASWSRVFCLLPMRKGSQLPKTNQGAFGCAWHFRHGPGRLAHFQRRLVYRPLAIQMCALQPHFAGKIRLWRDLWRYGRFGVPGSDGSRDGHCNHRRSSELGGGKLLRSGGRFTTSSSRTSPATSCTFTRSGSVALRFCCPAFSVSGFFESLGGFLLFGISELGGAHLEERRKRLTHDVHVQGQDSAS